MDRVDYFKEQKELYRPSRKVVSVVEVPPMNFFEVDGEGDPNDNPDYQEAMQLLYGSSYTLKFMLKGREGHPDWRVMPLEGLWWAQDMSVFHFRRKEEWLWTAMIRQPDFITPELAAEAREELRRKKDPPGFERLRFGVFEEGASVQILHVGPYDDEGPTIERMHDFALERGYRLRGKHHEIYLGDPRRSKPENLRTILRQPITKAD